MSKRERRIKKGIFYSLAMLEYSILESIIKGYDKDIAQIYVLIKLHKYGCTLKPYDFESHFNHLYDFFIKDLTITSNYLFNDIFNAKK